jgi:two-component system chemotaxis family response regulator WspR
MKVLYIGDQTELPLLKSFQCILQLYCLETIEEAIWYLNNHQQDRVNTFILLQDNSPIEAIIRLRSTVQGRTFPIIVMLKEENSNFLKKLYKAGASDYMITPLCEIKLMFRINSLKNIISEQKSINREKELMIRIKQLEDSNEELKKLSMKDDLTEIYNRRYFESYMKGVWKQAFNNNQNISIIMVDIDDFKAFNDTYGHRNGDTCLKQVALTLQHIASQHNGVVARYGGEEFVGVFLGYDDEELMQIAEEMRVKVEQLDTLFLSVGVTISLGIASAIPHKKISYELLLSAADKALYRVKDSGRNGCFSLKLS